MKLLKNKLSLLILSMVVFICAFSLSACGQTKKQYTVTLPGEQTGFAITYSDSTNVDEGGSFSFGVSIADGYETDNLVVKANETTLTADSGLYTIANITSNVTISVSGVKQSAPVVRSLSVTTQPTKREYYIGESLDAAGLVVTKALSNSTTEVAQANEVEIDTANAFNSAVAGNYEIKVALKSDSSIFTTFTVSVSYRTFENVTAVNVTKVYDGNSYSITVNCEVDGVTVLYSTDEGENKTYAQTNPSFSDVGEYRVFYKVTKAGYTDYLGDCYVNISSAAFLREEITVSAENVVYDGNSHGVNSPVLPTGATIGYCTEQNGTYTAIPPTFVNAGEYTVYFKVSKANYSDFEDNVAVKIKKAAIEGISATGTTVVADGESHCITVVGAQAGDVISYSASADGAWAAENIACATGITTVYYRVQRGINYEATGSATVTIIPNVLLDGISVRNITATWSTTFTGEAFTSRNFTGLHTDDLVYYSEDNATWETTCRTFTEPSDTPYTVYVKVYRVNAGYFTATATVTINKAEYPTGTARGFNIAADWTEGLTLADIATANNFAALSLFFNEPDTELLAKTYSSISGYYNADPTHYKNYPVTFSLTVSPKSAPDGTLVVEDCTFTYDEQPHTNSVGGTGYQNYSVTYQEPDNIYAPYRSEQYSFTDANEAGYYVYWKATRDNYETLTGRVKITINRALYTGITHENITVTYTDNMTLSDINSELSEHFYWKEAENTAVSVGTADRVVCYDNEAAGVDNYVPFELTISLTVTTGTITDVQVSNVNVTYDGNSHGFSVNARQDDQIWLSISNDPYAWQDYDTSVVSIFNNIKDAGVHTVWYKVSRDNYNDLISYATVTITPAAATYTVTVPSGAKWDGNNHTISINTSIGKDQYTVYYSGLLWVDANTTEDKINDIKNGTYTATVPVCSLPAQYLFFIKPESNNYTFTDDPNGNLRRIEFTVDKVNGDNYNFTLVFPDAELVTGGQYTAPDFGTVFFGIKQKLELPISWLGLEYSLDYDETNPSAATWQSTATVTMQTADIKVWYKITTDLVDYVDYLLVSYVTA